MAIKKSSSSGIPSGLSAGRPANPGFGQLYANGETARLELFTQASGWQNIVQETPGVSSITGTYLESNNSGTITISGTNFVSGAIASVVGTNGVEIQATSTTYNSLVQLTATFTGLSNALEPYDVKVTNPSNLFGLIPDVLYINASPVWQTASGSLGTFAEQLSMSVSATAIDDSTISYSLASGSTLPSGISLNSSTGVISGTLPDISTNTTYTFTINASDGSNPAVPRTFSFVSNAAPVWSTLSGSLGTFAKNTSFSTSPLSVTDSDSFTYSLASGSTLPSGFTLNSSTGVISGVTPNVTTTTTYTFTINASDGLNVIPRSFSITSSPDLTVEFLLFGAGGGSGSSNRSSTSYRTNNYYRVKEGGAGGVVYASYDVKYGTQLTLSVGGGGQGGMLSGNPSSAYGGYNGGGAGTFTQNDCSGGGGGYSGVFLTNIGKSQSGAIAISPGGGGGGGGPGYPRSNEDQANGGGGITSTGIGNNGTRQNSPSAFIAVAVGGGLTSGGAGGDASISNGDGAAGSLLSGANSVYYNNAWGCGGAGGGGWFGGGSGANDGSDWSGGGGAAGSAFVRGSGNIYTSSGNGSLNGIIYKTHTFYPQTYATYGDGSNPSFGPVSAEMNPGGVLNSMRMPVQTTNPQYPGSNVAYGGAFRNSTSDPSGYTGGNGAIVYRINGEAWQTVSYTGSDTTITVQ